MFTSFGDASPMLAAPLILAFPALAIVAGLKDATSYTIPNWISLALLALYAPAALAVGVPLGDMGLSLAAGFGALLAGMAMFALGWIGGGDAKFLAAAALWLGLPALPSFLLLTALCGGALSVGLLALRAEWLRPLVLSGPAWIERLATPKADAPYGVAICVGALMTFPMSTMASGLTLH